MQNPNDFYAKQILLLLKKYKQVKKQLLNNSILRFFVFFAIIIGIYYTFKNTLFVGIITTSGIIVFTFLVNKHTHLKRKKSLLKIKLNINKTEIEVLKQNFHHLDTGEEFIDKNHFFSNDIDLFGVGSFFQYINRTTTDEGKEQLAKTLTKNNVLEIEKKQQALQELSKKIKWRQHFSATASLIDFKKNTKTIAKWILNYTPKLSKNLLYITKGFSLISIILAVLVVFGILYFSILLLWLLVGLIFTGIYLKVIQKLYLKTSNAKEVFHQYYLLLEQIEKEAFSSSYLKERQTKIQTKQKKASFIFKDFSKILDAFDQRNNIFIAIFGNGLFMWDIRNSIKIEQWIYTYKDTVKQWFEVIGFFDAQNSLANFVYNNPNYVFAEICKAKTGINAKQLGHPLLSPSKRIDNDFLITNEEFFIITGANMAGKSTFLRTVSLSIVMANCGLPVCAKSYKYKPVKLITSMRTSDSLTDDESYFYSELKRLKFIVSQIELDSYFIILDEILKGTNSKDKAIGSKKFVEKLKNSKSTGIIATHDVSLCELEKTNQQIKNYYFDAKIISGELSFDYKLKAGICKNMNASFLLEKMKIV